MFSKGNFGSELSDRQPGSICLYVCFIMLKTTRTGWEPHRVCITIPVTCSACMYTVPQNEMLIRAICRLVYGVGIVIQCFLSVIKSFFIKKELV